jgi:hypothetical protein
MALRREDLNPEELARQRALDRSWSAARESLSDPEFRAYLEASIERVNLSVPSRSVRSSSWLRPSHRLGSAAPRRQRVPRLDRAGVSELIGAERHPTFIAELGDQPWRAPSVPIAKLSSQPQYEVRTAALEVNGEQDVRIWWAHVYATGDVDLIAITNR